MSKHKFYIGEGQYIEFGIDRPYNTLFISLWDCENDEFPVKAAGYHPDEQASSEAGEWGPYPLDFDSLDDVMKEWRLTGEMRERVGREIAKDA